MLTAALETPPLTDPSTAGVFEVGQFIERYELITKIAEGGMAVIWLARVTGSYGFEKLVALKTIRPLYVHDPAYHRMFRDESDIAARVKHPHVVELHDVGEYAGAPFQVLEWIDGEALAGLHRVALRKGKLIHPAIALKIVAQVCAGLSAVHDLEIDGVPQGVVHRDVSPQNVLVSQEGHVKLIDFGIAKAHKRMAEETRTGVVKGKLRYIAPEQARGDKVDHRADLWACGVMLHQLLLGTTPLRSKGMAGEKGAPKEVSFLDRVDPEVRAALEKALAENPQDRFATAREMEVELERLAQRRGPITPADIARAVEPLREQRAARMVVIEGALDASRQRNIPSTVAPGGRRAAISLVSDQGRTMVSPGVKLESSDAAVKHQLANAVNQNSTLPPNDESLPVFSEKLAELGASMRELTEIAARQTRGFVSLKCAVVKERAQKHPVALKRSVIAGCILVLAGLSYGAGYQNGFHSSGPTVVSGPINISLKDVPVCRTGDASATVVSKGAAMAK